MKKIKDKSAEAEIIFIVQEITRLKDVLAEFGKEISDVIYKPVDIDILETLIKRAEVKYIAKNESLRIQKEKEDRNSQNDDLNARIIDLNSRLKTLSDEKEKLYNELQAAMKQEKDSCNKNDDQIRNLEEKVLLLENASAEEKKTVQQRTNQIIALTNALRKCFGQNLISEIFTLFEESLSSGLNIANVRICEINSSNTDRTTVLYDALNNNKLYVESENCFEIPFIIDDTIYSIVIPDKINLNDFYAFFVLFRDVMAYVTAITIIKQKYSIEAEKEKENSKIFATVLANTQAYIKESMSAEKIKNIREELMKVTNDILDLVMDSQEKIIKMKKNKSLDDSDLVIDALSKIIDGKNLR